MNETKAEISQHYLACTDSVDLIDRMNAKAVRTEEEDAAIERNQAHLRLMLTRDYWTTEDLAPLKAACGHA